MDMPDAESAISITRNIFWVGFQESERLRCNPYLMVDGDCAVLFDPGSIPDFPLMMRKTIDIVDPSRIELVVVHHQDPDVAGSLPVLEDVVGRADMRVVSHINTHRLIRHLGHNSTPIVFDGATLTHELSTGDHLEFIWTPYAHSPGAMVTWHETTGTLFSGDIFGAIEAPGDLFDPSGYPEAMASFHQAYMPSNEVLRGALARFEHLPIQRILPQHGNVIEGSAVKEALDYLKDLPCGLDLL